MLCVGSVGLITQQRWDVGPCPYQSHHPIPYMKCLIPMLAKKDCATWHSPGMHSYHGLGLPVCPMHACDNESIRIPRLAYERSQSSTGLI